MACHMDASKSRWRLLRLRRQAKRRAEKARGGEAAAEAPAPRVPETFEPPPLSCGAYTASGAREVGWAKQIFEWFYWYRWVVYW